MVNIGNSWDEVLAGEFEKEYYQKLREFLIAEYSAHQVYPPMEHIFRALKETPYDKVKAVILGQDPYHEPGQAQGLPPRAHLDRGERPTGVSEPGHAQVAAD